ncbi:MAG: ADP-glyceromanno-heptose 6-epimerase [Candidatus Kapabacteria bacterium]|nr:ADP-glyceromanno-heptose 6-epimerase [Candidatus Kapabacteria bacterium]
MILLTGGAGFIGSCFLHYLNQHGFSDVLVVDHLGHGEKWKNLVGKQFLYYENKDVFRNKLLNKVYDGKISGIIHFGACSTTTEKDADYLLNNNFSYSKDIAEFAIRNEIKMIYASSAATYGNGAAGYGDAEFFHLKPLNLYGFSKQLFDLWVLERGFDKKLVGLKFFNVFGPNEYHKGEMASMIYKAHNQIRDTGKVKLFKTNHSDYPDGGQLRDFVYIKDVCNLLWTIFNDDNIHGIYNLGTGKAHSWNELANAVFNALDKPVDIEYVDMPDDISKQYQNYTCAEMTKLTNTGIKFSFDSLETSIADYVRTHLNQDWQYL